MNAGRSQLWERALEERRKGERVASLEKARVKRAIARLPAPLPPGVLCITCGKRGALFEGPRCGDCWRRSLRALAKAFDG